MHANGSGPPTTPVAAVALLDDDRLTALGLLIETHAGLRDVYERQLDELGFPGSSFEVMLRLARSPGHRLRMTELAAQSVLTNSGLTRLVDRLEAAGSVSREACPTDRRGFYACLTPSGLDRLVAALPEHLATIDKIFTGVLTAEELEMFLAVLRKLRAVVNPASDPDFTHLSDN